MKPNYENVDMPDKTFPIRISMNSSDNHRIFVHPHWHEEIEILYMVTGDAIQQINENVFRLVPGDLAIIGSNDIHATYTEHEGRYEILVLQFGSGLVKSINLITPEKKWVDDFLDNLEFTGPIPLLRNERIVAIIYNLYQELREQNPAYEVFVKAGLYELIGLLIREYRQFARERHKIKEMDRTRQMLQNTFQLIDENYSRNLTLNHAARVSNLSVAHLCRLFKRFTGMTFKEYLTVYRISRAEEFLQEGQSITETAYACGFNSIDSFIRAFKKQKKCTPSTYRKKMMEINGKCDI